MRRVTRGLALAVTLCVACSKSSSSPTTARVDGGAGQAPADWVTTLGTGRGRVAGMVADATGPVVVGTLTSSVTVAGQTLTAPSRGAAFVVRLDPKGTPLWGLVDTALPPGSTSNFDAVALAADGTLLLGAHFDGAMEIAGTRITAKNAAALVALSPDGSHVLWSQLVQGGGIYDFPTVEAVAVAPSGAIVISGSLIGTATIGPASVTSPDPSGGLYLASFGATGAPQWAEIPANTPPASINPQPDLPLLAVGSTGNIHLATTTQATGVDGGAEMSGGVFALNTYAPSGALLWTASGTGTGGAAFKATGITTIDSTPLVAGSVGQDGLTGPTSLSVEGKTVTTPGYLGAWESDGKLGWLAGIDNGGAGPLLPAGFQPEAGAAYNFVYALGLFAPNSSLPALAMQTATFDLGSPGGAPIELATSSQMALQAVATTGTTLYAAGTAVCPLAFGAVEAASCGQGSAIFVARVIPPL